MAGSIAVSQGEVPRFESRQGLPASPCVSVCLPVSPCVFVCLPASLCVSLHLCVSPCVSVCLPASPCVSLRLPVSLCVSLRLPVPLCDSLTWIKWRVWRRVPHVWRNQLLFKWCWRWSRICSLSRTLFLLSVNLLQASGMHRHQLSRSFVSSLRSYLNLTVLQGRTVGDVTFLGRNTETEQQRYWELRGQRSATSRTLL